MDHNMHHQTTMCTGPLDAPNHKMQWTIRHTRFQKANVGKS